MSKRQFAAALTKFYLAQCAHAEQDGIAGHACSDASADVLENYVAES